MSDYIALENLVTVNLPSSWEVAHNEATNWIVARPRDLRTVGPVDIRCASREDLYGLPVTIVISILHEPQDEWLARRLITGQGTFVQLDGRNARFVRWTDGINAVSSWLVQFEDFIVHVGLGLAALGSLANVAARSGVTESVVEAVRLRRL